MPRQNDEDEFRQGLLSFQQQQSRPQSRQDVVDSVSNSFTRFGDWFRTSTQSLPGVQGLTGNSDSSMDSSCFGMTRMQRLLAFGMCTATAALCFFIAFMTLPTVILMPSKFALTYTFGSLLSMASFAFLRGWRPYGANLISPERRWFTAAYFGSMFLTLYAVFVAHSYILVIICTIIQFIAILWFYASYLPGGTTGMQFITRSFFRAASGSSLPI